MIVRNGYREVRFLSRTLIKVEITQTQGMITMTRTDIHRPSAPEFDPEKYVCVGVFDTNSEWGDNRRRALVVSECRAKGYSFKDAPHGSGQCSHCGAQLRYCALMLHRESSTMLYVGETCLDHRFSVTLEEFKRAREEGKARAESCKRRERIEALVSEHPLLAWLTYGVALDDNDFLQSISRQLLRDGALSARQIETVERAIVRDTEFRDRRAAQKAEEEASRITPAPTGRVTVTGTIFTIKEQENLYSYYGGITFKMGIKTEGGWKLWTTMPRSLIDELDFETAKGTKVQITVTVKPSDRDQFFGFGSRPSNAKILSTPNN